MKERKLEPGERFVIIDNHDASPVEDYAIGLMGVVISEVDAHWGAIGGTFARVRIDNAPTDTHLLRRCLSRVTS